MNRLSRTLVARYIADRIQAGETLAAIRELAAYLIESRRTREADLVIRTIYDELETRGIVLADVTTIDDLDAASQQALAELIAAKELVVRHTVNPDIIGGVVVRTPARLLDASFRRRIARLREHKV